MLLGWDIIGVDTLPVRYCLYHYLYGAMLTIDINASNLKINLLQQTGVSLILTLLSYIYIPVRFIKILDVNSGNYSPAGANNNTGFVPVNQGFILSTLAVNIRSSAVRQSDSRTYTGRTVVSYDRIDLVDCLTVPVCTIIFSTYNTGIPATVRKQLLCTGIPHFFTIPLLLCCCCCSGIVIILI